MSSIIASSKQYFADLNSALTALPEADICGAAELIESAFLAGKQVFIAGNGGSAATASHMACDFAKTTLGKSHERISFRIKAIALSDNVPAITAWGNDVSYDLVFSEQLRNLANEGDLLVVITCSGNSPNILETLKAAKELGLQTLGLLGFAGGKALPLCDKSIVVCSEDYGVIEDAHSILNHLLTAHMKARVQGL
jgi:D-sedoheptulose 7-phosphate isomerase